MRGWFSNMIIKMCGALLLLIKMDFRFKNLGPNETEFFIKAQMVFTI